MRGKPEGKGPPSVRLDRERYEQLRDVAETHRERLVIRLGGEVGLRPVEMTQIHPSDLTAHTHEGHVYFFLIVGDGEPREAHLPNGVEQVLRRYVESNNIEDGERVLPITPRRVQMLVSSVADRAAEATSDPAFREVSSADLRRYFAYVLLVERGVTPAVVMAIGGWKRLDSLDPYVEPAEPDEVVAALNETNESEAKTTHHFRDALDYLKVAVILFDANGTTKYVNRRFEAVTGLSTSAVQGNSLRDLSAANDPSIYADIWETVTSGEVWLGNFALHREIGEPMKGRLTLIPIPSGAGVPEQFVATFAGSPVETGEAKETLERLSRVNAAVRSVEKALPNASTREEVFRRVCEEITDSAAYECAWVSDVDPDGTVVPRIWVGADEGTIEQLALADPCDVHPEARAVEMREVQVIPLKDARVFAADDNAQPLQSFSIFATPLMHGDTVFGALSVVGPWLGDDIDFERTALSSLGERIGHTLAAIEWKQLLLADTVLELEFVSKDDDSFFVSASTAMDCTLRLEGVVPVKGQKLLHYVTISGVSSEEAIAFLADVTEDTRLISDYHDESLLEVTATDASLVATLVNHGGAVQKLIAEDGEARLISEFAPDIDVRTLDDKLTASFPGTEIVAKREVERPVRTPAEFHQTVEEELTPKQRSVLKAAYHAEYFDWPRGSTAEDLADSLGISSPTLHNHLRRAQKKLLTTFFDEPSE